jgi:cell division transport system permease protein
MKANTTLYQEPGKFGSRPNYFYAMISISLVLFILGIFGFILFNTRQLISFYKENLNLIVEISETGSSAQMNSLKEWLSTRDFYKKGSLSVIDKEEAIQLMRKDFGEDFLKLDLPNPFLDIITFNVREAYLERSSLTKIKKALLQFPNVKAVYFQDSFLNSLLRNMNKFLLFTFSLTLILLAISSILIFNTIKLALHSQRFIIKNMELVGATWQFISAPFLKRSFTHGIISSMLSLTGLGALYFWLLRNIPELVRNLPADKLFILASGVTFAGIFIYLFSTYIVVNRYLKMRVDDLY